MILINNIIFNSGECFEPLDVTNRIPNEYQVVGIRTQYQPFEEDNFYSDYWLDVFIGTSEYTGNEIYLINVPLLVKKGSILLSYDFRKIEEVIFNENIFSSNEHFPDYPHMVDFNQLIKEHSLSADSLVCRLTFGDLHI